MLESKKPRSDQPNAEVSTEDDMMTEWRIDRRTFMGIAGAAVVGTTLVGRAGHAADAAPRLLVDRMLQRPARWLRAAGYDAAVPPSAAPLRDLLRQAAGEDRIFVSRNRKLAELRDPQGRLVVLAEQRLPKAAAELTARLGIDWLRDPFSRCVLCNGSVEVADPAIWWPAPATNRVPLADVLPLTRCEPCDQLYWRGGHARRMQARLDAWAAGRFV